MTGADSHFAKTGTFDQLLSIEDVGKLIGAKRSRIYELMTSGDITAVKMGGSTRVKQSELERWVSTLRAATFRPSPTLL